MSLKEYSAADGAHIDSTPSFDTAGAEQRLAEDREWYAHQAMQGRAPDVIVQIPLADVHESPHNPRQTYNAKADAELDESVRAVGIMQAVLVRPVRLDIDPVVIGHYELVFGHRRLRSAQRCGLATITATVQEISDVQAAQMQAIENLQREDITPMEEAKGYADYIWRHHITKDQLAEQIGKSRTYVYNRLKLASLAGPAAQALQRGDIKPEVATLIARVPEKLQDKALVLISTDHPGRHGEPAPFRWVRDQLLEKFSLDLKEAIFSTDDAALVPAAGACKDCPNRSGNTPELYQDVVERASWTSHWMAKEKGSANICMDPDCYAVKKKAHLVAEAKKLEATGKTVVTGNAAKAALSSNGTLKGSYVAYKDVRKVMGQIDAKERPQIVMVQDPRTGKTIEAVKRHQIAGFGADVAKAVAKPSHQDTYAQQREKAETEAKLRTADNRRLLDAVRAAAAKEPRSVVDLQLVATAMLINMPEDDADLVAELHGHEFGRQLVQAIEAMSPDDLALLLLDFALVQNVQADHWNPNEKPETLLAAAEHYGVQVGLGTVAQSQDDEEGPAA